MRNFVMITDSSCDVSREVLNRWGVETLKLTYTFDGDDRVYTEGDLSSGEFYDKMRAGEVVRTSAANVEDFKRSFTRILEQGKDVLYISISSTFSGTYQSSCIAAQELQEKYPQRKIRCVDTRCASAGHALMVFLAAKKRDADMALEEIAAFLEESRQRISQWLTVEDLMYLKRGGRLGAKEAVVGKLLGVKPLLHINDETRFEVSGAARGRKKALAVLSEKFLETRDENADEDLFIFHADCLEDARAIAQKVKEKLPSVKVEFSGISACIGAHFGPGAIFCAFVGTQR